MCTSPCMARPISGKTTTRDVCGFSVLLVILWFVMFKCSKPQMKGPEGVLRVTKYLVCSSLVKVVNIARLKPFYVKISTDRVKYGEKNMYLCSITQHKRGDSPLPKMHKSGFAVGRWSSNLLHNNIDSE